MRNRGIHLFVWAHLLAVALIYGLALWVGGQAGSEPFPLPEARRPVAATPAAQPSHAAHAREAPEGATGTHREATALAHVYSPVGTQIDLAPRWSAD